MSLIFCLIFLGVNYAQTTLKSSVKHFEKSINSRTKYPVVLNESYKEVLLRIKTERRQMKKQNIPYDPCKAYFLQQFEFSIFPHWIGTKWDYNGYTNEPGEDKLIACGYFVSTSLKHMGFNWNRFDLAKMYSKKNCRKDHFSY